MPYWKCPRCGSTDSYEGTELQQKVTGSGGGSSVGFIGNQLGDSGITPMMGQADRIKVSSNTIEVSVRKCKKCDTLLSKKDHYLTEEEKREREAAITLQREKRKKYEEEAKKEEKRYFLEDAICKQIGINPIWTGVFSGFKFIIILSSFYFGAYLVGSLPKPQSLKKFLEILQPVIALGGFAKFCLAFIFCIIISYCIIKLVGFFFRKRKKLVLSKISINFECKSCALKFHLPNSVSLKVFKCPQCNNMITTPYKNEIETIKYYCSNCSQKFELPIELFGNKFLCSKCNHKEGLLDFPSYNRKKLIMDWVAPTRAKLKEYSFEE